MELDKVNEEKTQRLWKERHDEYRSVLEKYEEEVVAVKAELKGERAKLVATEQEKNQLSEQVLVITQRAEDAEKLLQLRDEDVPDSV